MREIKFRAWDGKRMQIPSVNMLIGSNNGAAYWQDGYYETVDFMNATVMQYTGLKDKNGKETFSDDIVSDGINPPFVVDLWNWPLMVRLAEIEFEVIGNIYENPELLTDTQKVA